MKRKTTKEILAESFRELAADRAIDKITVQEIVSNCAYSSATFTDTLRINTTSSPGTTHRKRRRSWNG